MTTVTDAGLALLVKLQPNLRRLDLGFVVGLTPGGYRHLAKLTKLEELKKEGQSGQKKINQYTRYATIGLSLFQSCFMVWKILRPRPSSKVLL